MKKPSVFIDLQRISKRYFEDEEKFFIEFCLMIGDALQIEENIDYYWQGRRSSVVKCSRYMNRYMIPKIGTPFILALDEVERILICPFRTNFFGMLRTWHNDRVHDESFAKMTLFLSSSTEPGIFVDTPGQSPFNVAEVVKLQDFSKEQVEVLNQRYNNLLNFQQLDQLFDLIGGHPFLTQLSFYLMATGRIDWVTLWKTATLEDGPFTEHLGRYWQIVLGKPDFKAALDRIIDRAKFNELDHTLYHLMGLGLIKKQTENQVEFRNKLYEDYFRRYIM